MAATRTLRGAFRKVLFQLLVIILITPRQGLSLDSEAWLFQHFAFERTNKRELFLTLHSRANDSEFPSLYQIQPRAAFAVTPWAWAGLNYSFFGVKRQDERIENEDLFTNQHRLEPEVQIRGTITDATRYVARNRYEYLLDSDFRNISERLRHRSQILSNFPYLSGVVVITQMEFFYDIDSGRINQTRTAPIGMRTTLGSWSLQAQPMIVHLKAPNAGWQPNLVANLELTYDFSLHPR